MNGECQLLRSKFDLLHADLESAAVDTTKLAYQLYSKSILGKGVRSEVDEATTPGKAASKLLGAVENRIETHPRDLHTFLECLATFPTWQHHAEDMAKKLKEIEAQLVQPLPVSDPSSFSPASSAVGGGHPVDIRLIINSSSRVSAVPVLHDNQQSSNFTLRSAPVDRKHPPQQMTTSTPVQSSKSFSNAYSPSSNSLSSLSSDQSMSTCTSSASLAIITEETTDTHDHSPPNDSIPLRTPSLGSQTSTSSTFEEEVVSMKGSLDELLTKFCNLRSKLHARERELKTLKAEQAKKDQAFATQIEAASQETKHLQTQVDSLQYENRELKDELETTRDSVVKGNQQKQALMSQLQDSFDELQRLRTRCSKLEEQIKAVTQDGEILDKYQKAREREKELEGQLEACRKTVIEYEDKIQLLEMEVNVLLGSGSLSLSSSFSSDGWALNPEQEDSGGSSLDSL